MAFVITDPMLFVPDYRVPIRHEQMEDLKLARVEDAHVFCIVNKVLDTLTCNLQGPLVVNTMTKWTTRHLLVRVPQAQPAAA